MNLSFAHPALAWGLLAALVPLAIHLFFRRRPRPLPFPAIDFILRARRRTERRLRLKKFLLFAARTLLAAAVAAAIARPRVERRAQAAVVAPRGAAAVAVVLDASASMRYRLGGSTLFARARSDALETIEALGGEEPATVVVCGGAAIPVAPAPSFDRAALRRVLNEATPSAGHSDLTSCVAAAAQALSDPAAHALGRRIVIATDLAASAWRFDVPAPTVQTPQGAQRPEVTVLDAARGAELPNAAVTELSAQLDPAVGPRGYRVTASVVARGAARSSASTPARDVELQLHAGPPQSPIVLRSYAQLGPDGALKKSLAFRFPQGGPAALSLTLSPGDALELDDARALALEVPRDVKALIVDGAPSPVRYRDEAFFVEAALASPASPVRPTVVDPESIGKVRLADFDVIFLLNVRVLGTKAAELRTFVERGGGLFIALGEAVDPERYDAELGALLPRPLHVVKTAVEPGTAAAEVRAARFADVDWTHPALRIFDGTAREGLEGVHTFKYALLKPGAQKGGGEHVLISYDDGAPALVEARRGQGRVLLFTSTLDRSWCDWSIRTSFLPAVQRFAAWLSGGLEVHDSAPSVVEVPRRVVMGDGQRLLALVAPDGRERPVSGLRREAGRQGDREEGTFTVVPDQPGLWQVKVEERGQVRRDPHLAFAVQPDPRESDTTRLDSQELTAYFGGAGHAHIASEAREGRRDHPLWSLLLVLALLAFVAEGALAA